MHVEYQFLSLAVLLKALTNSLVIAETGWFRTNKGLVFGIDYDMYLRASLAGCLHCNGCSNWLNTAAAVSNVVALLGGLHGSTVAQALQSMHCYGCQISRRKGGGYLYPGCAAPH
jgi:hypothetical protein